LFTLFGLSLCCFVIVRAVSGLFFIGNEEVLIYTIFAVAILQVISATIMGYIISYLKFPNISPWIMTSVVFIIGLFIIYSSSRVGYEAIVTEWGAINWTLPTSPFGTFYSILRSLLLAFAFIPVSFIFLQQAKETENKILKKRSIGLAIVLFGASLIGILDYILVGVLGLEIIYRDISMFVLGIILFLVVIFTQASPQKYQKKIQ
jgi:hypothetical protein